MTDEEQKARWFGLVQEWGASELSIQVFLKQRAISHSTFYRWRIRYEQEHLAALIHAVLRIQYTAERSQNIQWGLPLRASPKQLTRSFVYTSILIIVGRNPSTVISTPL